LLPLFTGVRGKDEFSKLRTYGVLRIYSGDQNA
jgi:hypothetical protein